MADEPHPDAKRFLEQIADAPPLSEQDLARARETHRRNAVSGGEEPVGRVEDVVIRGDGHGLPVRVYVPEGNGPFPVLVWAHGGGFVLGDIDTEDSVGRALTNEGPCIVASVDYRLSPEHKFPAALRDFYAVTEWAAADPPGFDVDPDGVGVGGASAGGQLAAASALLARDQDGPDIDYQVLVYPAVSHDEEFPSKRAYDGYFVTREEVTWTRRQYLGDPLLGYNPYAAPLQASDFTNLPPATVITAEFDPYRDDGFAYVEELESAGVRVRHSHYDDMIHAFFGRLRDPEWERAREAVNEVGTHLVEEFSIGTTR